MCHLHPYRARGLPSPTEPSSTPIRISAFQQTRLYNRLPHQHHKSVSILHRRFDFGGERDHDGAISRWSARRGRGGIVGALAVEEMAATTLGKGEGKRTSSVEW